MVEGLRIEKCNMRLRKSVMPYIVYQETKRGISKGHRSWLEGFLRDRFGTI